MNLVLNTSLEHQSTSCVWQLSPKRLHIQPGHRNPRPIIGGASVGMMTNLLHHSNPPMARDGRLQSGRTSTSSLSLGLRSWGTQTVTSPFYTKRLIRLDGLRMWRPHDLVAPQSPSIACHRRWIRSTSRQPAHHLGPASVEASSPRSCAGS